MPRHNTLTNASGYKKSAAAAAPKESRSKRRGANKSFNLPNIPSSGSLDARREDRDPFADGDTQQDEGTDAQSILLKYKEIRGG